MANYIFGLNHKSIKVEAPFEMPAIVIPDFSNAPVFNIIDFGAIKGDKAKISNAIHKAIEKANSTGGGTVLIPEGQWLTGKIHFKSYVNLHLEKGAVLLFSEDPKDYLPAVHSTWEGMECYNYSPLIYAYNCSNVAITGEGEIKAKMETWKKWAGRPSGHMNNLKQLYMKASYYKPVEERYMINDSANFRPQFVQFNRCTNVLMDGIKITNSPFWTVHTYMSKDIVLRNLNIYAHGHNNDGIDPEMSQNMLIENCYLDQGDDAIAIKSGRNQDAWRLNMPTKNLVIRNVTVKNGHQLVAVGSELSGGVENVFVHDCEVLEGAKLYHLLFIKTNERRGGYVKNIHFRDVKSGKIDLGILGIETNVLYQWKNLVPTIEPKLTPIQGIYLDNVKSGQVKFIARILGEKELPIRDIKLNGVSADSISESKYILENFEGQITKDIELSFLNNPRTNASNISWGVPFAKGQIKKEQNFQLSTEKGINTALQQWPLAFWNDGSVKWMGFAAANLPNTKFTLSQVNQNSTQGKIVIDENDNQIKIGNGKITCIVNKKGDIFIENLSIKDKIVANKGMLNMSLIQHKNKSSRIEEFTGRISKVTVEQNGPIRTVLKFEGTHLSQNGKKELLPFNLRLYFYQNSEEIKIVHSFVYNGDQNKDFIQSLGISFAVPFREKTYNRHIRFAGEGLGLWSEPVKPIVTRYPFTYQGDRNISQMQMAGQRVPEIKSDDQEAFTHIQKLAEWNDFKLVQTQANGFTISKRTNPNSSWLYSNAGNRSNGLAFVGDVSGGISLSVKNFWQSYPASLEITGARSSEARIYAWLWSPDAQAMDLRHYDVEEHGLLTTYEDIEEGLSTPYGISRTSELTLTLCDTLPSKMETATMAQKGSETQLLICTPSYYHQAQAFAGWTPRKAKENQMNPTEKRIETQLQNSIDYYNQSVDEHQWYGFWNYGDVMHTSDEYRHGWRYDIGGYAWDNTELAPNLWLWLSFIRTGDPTAFKLAEAMTRHTSEVDVYHLGKMKGLGSRHNVSHWGCGAKEARIGQAWWKRPYYYLTADERTGDLMDETIDAEQAAAKLDPLRNAQPKSEFPYDAPARLRWGPDWVALAGNWLTALERTQDKQWENKIMAGLNSLCALPNNLYSGPLGLGYDPSTGKFNLSGDQERTHRNHLATLMGGFEFIDEMFNHLDIPEFKKTYTEYAKYYNMPQDDPQREADKKDWGDTPFRIPRLTAFAAQNLNDSLLMKRAWREFINERRGNSARDIYKTELIEGPEFIRPIHEAKRISTNSTAQWGLNAIYFLQFSDKFLPMNSQEKEFNEHSNLNWNQSFEDNFSSDWKNLWFLDGEKASLKSGNGKLEFRAGSIPASDHDHSVLWTHRDFEGSLKIEFDFVRKDSATKYVNILYLLASGSGIEPYKEDIATWKNLRSIPAMNKYFNGMNALHLSFAAFENNNTDPESDYIRVRRYMPLAGNGLNNTELNPDYFKSSVFKPEVNYHIELIFLQNADKPKPESSTLILKVSGDAETKFFTWNENPYPALSKGKIGIRLMGSRSSEFSNFKVSELARGK